MSESRRVHEILQDGEPGASVRVQGWLKTARHAKERSFLEVSDGSSMAGIQVVAEPTLSNYADEVRALRAGCAVAVAGQLVPSPGKGQRVEVHATDVALVGGVVGCILVLPVNGLTTGTINWATFTHLSFAFAVTPDLLVVGLIFAVVMGVVGGLPPAVRAVRTPITAALRQL